MSAVSSEWSKMKGDVNAARISVPLSKTDQFSIYVHQPKRAATALAVTTCTCLIVSIIEKIRGVAIKKLADMQNGNDRIVFDDLFDGTYIKEVIDSGDDAMAESMSQGNFFNVTKEEALRMVPSIKKIVGGFFDWSLQKHQRAMLTSDDVKAWAEILAVDSWKYVYAHIGMQKVEVLKGEAALDSCFNYALKQIDPDAAILFSKNYRSLELLKCLTDLKWENVEEPAVLNNAL